MNTKRSTGTTGIKLLASAGVLGSVLALAGTSEAGPNNGLYRIAPQLAPHKTWDLPSGGCNYASSNQSGTIALWSHNANCSNSDQRWYLQDKGGSQYEIRVGSSSGRCLDLNGVNNAVGTWDCNNGSNQRWYIDNMDSGGNDSLYGLWRIKSVANGRVIDLTAAGTGNGTVVTTWGDTGSPQQRWIFWSGGSGGGGMRPDFEDDFNGGSLDGGVWTAGNFGAGRFNGELQNYTPGNVWVSGGSLHIQANPSGCTGMGCYTSGRINSKGKRWYRNGMFSARIHYSDNGGTNMGTWPAFWLLGNNVNEDPYSAATVGGQCWPLSTAREMDIWEWVRNNNGSGYINNGIISNGGCNSAVHQATNGWSWNWNDWVIVSARIDGGRVKFYRGGMKTHDIPDAGLANEDFAFIFNLAVGGGLGGDNSGFTSGKWAQLEVDWVAHETW